MPSDDPHVDASDILSLGTMYDQIRELGKINHQKTEEIRELKKQIQELKDELTETRSAWDKEICLLLKIFKRHLNE